MASGKSTLARELAEALDAELLSADAIRLEERQSGERAADWPGFSASVYRELFRRARATLQSGRPVVLDGTFRSRALRARARELAAELHVPFLFFECRADLATCRARLREREREQGHGGWLELFDHFLGLWEPVDELPPAQHRVVETAGPVGRRGVDGGARVQSLLRDA
jgi:predicted kinase